MRFMFYNFATRFIDTLSDTFVIYAQFEATTESQLKLRIDPKKLNTIKRWLYNRLSPIALAIFAFLGSLINLFIRIFLPWANIVLFLTLFAILCVASISIIDARTLNAIPFILNLLFVLMLIGLSFCATFAIYVFLFVHISRFNASLTEQ